MVVCPNLDELGPVRLLALDWRLTKGQMTKKNNGNQAAKYEQSGHIKVTQKRHVQLVEPETYGVMCPDASRMLGITTVCAAQLRKTMEMTPEQKRTSQLFSRDRERNNAKESMPKNQVEF